MALNKYLIDVHEQKDLKLPEFFLTSVSIRTGKKFYLSIGDTIKTPLKPEDFIEVVDYDPVRNSVLAVGNKNPVGNVPLHWFIYRTFPQVEGIAIINFFDEIIIPDELGIKKVKKDIAIFRTETVLEILPQMKEENCIDLLERGILFYDSSYEKLANSMTGFLKDLDRYATEKNKDEKSVEGEKNEG